MYIVFMMELKTTWIATQIVCLNTIYDFPLQDMAVSRQMVLS